MQEEQGTLAVSQSRIKETAAALRQIKKEEVLAHSHRKKACLDGVDTGRVLASHQVLQQVGSWQAVPHCCPCVVLPTSAAQAAASIDKSEAASLTKAWRERHKLIPHTSLQKKEKKEVTKACLKQGFCTCSPRGKLVMWFWQVAVSYLKHHFQSPDKLPLLTGGHICLLWHARAVGGDEGTLPVERAAVHIPLHYLRPWRPTFMQIHCEQWGHEVFQLADREVYITPAHPPDADLPAFHSPHSFLDGLNLDHRWWMTITVLSERRIPFIDSAGKIRVKVEIDATWLVWEGRAREESKRRRGAA